MCLRQQMASDFRALEIVVAKRSAVGIAESNSGKVAVQVWGEHLPNALLPELLPNCPVCGGTRTYDEAGCLHFGRENADSAPRRDTRTDREARCDTPQPLTAQPYPSINRINRLPVNELRRS
jgi:hypothetical protein